MFKPIRFLTFLFLLLLMILPTVSYSQRINSNTTDSLRNVIDKSSGTLKVTALLELSRKVLHYDAEEALKLAKSALEECKTHGLNKPEIQSLIAIGRIYTDQKKMDEALACFDNALQIADQINDVWTKGEILYYKGVVKFRTGEEMPAFELFSASIQASRLSDNFKIAGSSYSIIGTIFRINGLYDRAIEYIIKAKLNYEKADFLEGSAWSAYLLGRIYADLKITPTALRYFSDALQIYREVYEVDGNGSGIAICYEQIGLLNITLGSYKEARRNFGLMKEIYTRQNSEAGISSAIKDIGILEYYVGNYAEAEELLKKGLALKTQLGDMLSLPGIYQNLGLCMLKTARENEGFSYLQQGLELATVNNQKKIQLDIYARMAEAYLNINDLPNAIKCQKKQIEIQDLLLSGDANIKLEQLQAIYEIDEKNQQIAELEKQNRINELNIRQQKIYQYFMIFGIVLALLISGTIYWFYNKLRYKNRELHESNVAKDKFFTIIAHDLRGPTSSLAGLLEQLNTHFDNFDKQELKEMISITSKSAENVNNLLENLLIWTQSQLNKIKFHPAVHSLHDIFQDAIYTTKPAAEFKEIDIRVEEKKGILVTADADMVQIILRNIINNAIKFTHRGGSVVIKADVEGNNLIRVSITDNGVGIESQQLQKIFDLANTQHTPGTENEKSTGLGLILVKYFVEKNNGTLTIDSQKDKGTTVSFTLPAAQLPGTQNQ